MDFASVVSAFLGGTVGSALTYVVAVRTLALQRRVDTIALFRQVTTSAHGYRDGTNEAVGLGEQIASIYLVADLGRRDDWLSFSGIAFLQELREWTRGLPDPDKDGVLDLEGVQRRERLHAAVVQAHGMLVDAVASRPRSARERWAGFKQKALRRRPHVPTESND